jgi:2-dehydro-3-deoxyphosphogluconate aldolase / (4S)-4-hydroxy-2-oxoglutarate aldolase
VARTLAGSCRPRGRAGTGKRTASYTRRVTLSEALTACPAVAILRAASAERFPHVIDVIADAGIRAVELTFTTPGVLDAIAAAAAHGYGGIALGAGTVLTTDDARRAVDAGATYLISPTITPEVLAEGARLGVPVVPGAMTPTEILAAYTAGAAMVKVFPCGAIGGPGYIRALRGPLPNIPLLPTGGVDIDTATEYLAAGAAAVGIGSPLQGDAASPDGDLSALRDRARRLVANLTDADG